MTWVNSITELVYLCVVIYCTLPFVCGQSIPGAPARITLPIRDPSVEFPFVATLDPEFILRWNHNDTHISIEMQARTTGYLAIGFSETGLMTPADIILGYITRDSRATLVDYYTTGYYPTVDQSQDLLLDMGDENNGWTIFRFLRPLDTCDIIGDRVITRDTMNVIYAIGIQKPTHHVSIPKHIRKGFKPLNLLATVPPPSGLTTNVSIAELLNNYTVPHQDLVHHCRLFVMDDPTFVNNRLHIVKIGPIFPTASADLVKKITLFRCRFTNPSTLNQTANDVDCFSDTAAVNCKEYVAGFTRDDQDLYLPDDIGIPMGGPNSANLYVLATVYENLNRETIRDESGIRIWFTPNLRRNDGAYLTIANPISDGWYQFIPQAAPTWTQRAYCSQACVKWGFNGVRRRRNDITIAGARFEGRKHAYAMRLRHLKSTATPDTMAEGPWLVSNENFQEAAQSLNLAETRRAVSANDAFLLECSYNTTFQATPVLGGWSDQNELCRAHVLYYPPLKLEGCFSWGLYNTMTDGAGNPIPNDRLFDELKRQDWSKPQLQDILVQIQNTSMHNAQCWSSQKTPPFHSHSFNQPTVTNPYVEPPSSRCSIFTGR